MKPPNPIERRGRARLHPGERRVWWWQLFALSLLAWFALQGLDRPVVGLVAAAAAATVAALIASDRPHRWRLHRLPGFALAFIVLSLRGGVDIAWRALHPALPIAPRFVRFPLDLPPGQPKTLFVSLLSLMPGTLSADFEDGGRTLIVHALTDEAEGTVADLQRRVRDLFALPGTEREARS
jgi:multicomponent Na+:H+ antiporter subunit E